MDGIIHSHMGYDKYTNLTAPNSDSSVTVVSGPTRLPNSKLAKWFIIFHQPIDFPEIAGVPFPLLFTTIWGKSVVRGCYNLTSNIGKSNFGHPDFCQSGPSTPNHTIFLKFDAHRPIQRKKIPEINSLRNGLQLYNG